MISRGMLVLWQGPGMKNHHDSRRRLLRMHRNDRPPAVVLDGHEKVSRTYGTSLGTYAFGLVLVLLLIWAFSYALREKNPDGFPTTPASTTPSQPSLLQSSVVPQPPQAPSSGGK